MIDMKDRFVNIFKENMDKYLNKGPDHMEEIEKVNKNDNTLIVLFIKFIHFAFIVYMVLTPIFAPESYLYLYIIIGPFLYLHWATNNDVCALTVMEQLLTGKKSYETYIGRIIKPIYNVDSFDIKLVTLILWLIAVWRLWSQYKFDMFVKMKKYLIE